MSNVEGKGSDFPKILFTSYPSSMHSKECGDQTNQLLQTSQINQINQYTNIFDTLGKDFKMLRNQVLQCSI